MTSKAELEGLRAHAAALQTEWRSVRAGAPEARLEKEREVQAEQLRGEIARLQGVLTQEVKNSGGSTEDALEAMKRAAALERQVTEAHEAREGKDEKVAQQSPPPNAYTSSSIAAAPAVPASDNRPAESDDEKEEGGSR